VKRKKLFKLAKQLDKDVDYHLDIYRIMSHPADLARAKRCMKARDIIQEKAGRTKP
jgi:hypothetical protein